MRRGLVVVVVVVAVATLALAAPVAAQETRKISVVGESSMEVANDRAVVRFAADVQRRSAAAALRASSARMDRVIAALRASGVEARDIQTTAIDVRRVSSRSRRRTRRGFIARNRVNVTVQQVRRAGDILAAGVRAGATGVAGPTFFRSNARALYRDSLVASFDDAKAKAERLAARSGLALGRPLNVRESGFEESVDLDSDDAEGLRAPAQRVTAPPVEPGTTTIDAKVFVTFEAS